jgi:hypothetical protein
VLAAKSGSGFVVVEIKIAWAWAYDTLLSWTMTTDTTTPITGTLSLFNQPKKHLPPASHILGVSWVVFDSCQIQCWAEQNQCERDRNTGRDRFETRHSGWIQFFSCRNTQYMRTLICKTTVVFSSTKKQYCGYLYANAENTHLNGAIQTQNGNSNFFSREKKSIIMQMRVSNNVILLQNLLSTTQIQDK